MYAASRRNGRFLFVYFRQFGKDEVELLFLSKRPAFYLSALVRAQGNYRLRRGARTVPYEREKSRREVLEARRNVLSRL